MDDKLFDDERNGIDFWTRDRNHGLTFLQKAERWFKKLIEKVQNKLVSGMDPSLMAVIIDLSHWSGDANIAEMVKSGVAMIITKACDGQLMYSGSSTDLQNYVDKTLRPNIQKCYDSNVPCGVYIYVKPYWSYFYGWTPQRIAQHHYNVFKEAVKGLVPGISYHLIAIDFEESGVSDQNVTIILNELYRLLSTDTNFGHLPIVWYSSMKYYNLYPNWAKSIAFSGTPHIFWMAQWSWTTYVKTTWDYVKTYIIAKLDMNVITPANVTWKILQFTGDRVEVPAFNTGGLDINLFKGTKEQLYSWLNFHAQVEPPIPPEEPPTESAKQKWKVVSSALNIRSGPGTFYADIGDLKFGDIVEQEDVGGTDAWIKTSAGWCCVQLSTMRFLEPVD